MSTPPEEAKLALAQSCSWELAIDRKGREDHGADLKPLTHCSTFLMGARTWFVEQAIEITSLKRPAVNRQ